MKKLLKILLAILLLPMPCNSMETTPVNIRNFLCMIAALPTDVQNSIAYYIAENDNQLESRIFADKQWVAWHPVSTEADKALESIKSSNGGSGLCRNIISQDYTKILCTKEFGSDSKCVYYDTSTKQLLCKDLIPTEIWHPMDISNNGKIWILLTHTSQDKNTNIIRVRLYHPTEITHIYEHLHTFSVHAPRNPSNDVKVCINKQGTKIAALLPLADKITFISKKLPAKDPKYPESLLGRYFREKGICKTFSTQNNH